MTRARLTTCLLILAGCLIAVLTTTAAASAAAPHDPVLDNGLIGYGTHYLTPDVPAAGSTYVDWRSAAPVAGCQSAAHPDPVVLIPGTYVNQAADFAAVSPLRP